MSTENMRTTLHSVLLAIIFSISVLFLFNIKYTLFADDSAAYFVRSGRTNYAKISRQYIHTLAFLGLLTLLCCGVVYEPNTAKARIARMKRELAEFKSKSRAKRNQDEDGKEEVEEEEKEQKEQKVVLKPPPKKKRMPKGLRRVTSMRAPKRTRSVTVPDERVPSSGFTSPSVLLERVMAKSLDKRLETFITEVYHSDTRNRDESTHEYKTEIERWRTIIPDSFFKENGPFHVMMHVLETHDENYTYNNLHELLPGGGSFEITKRDIFGVMIQAFLNKLLLHDTDRNLKRLGVFDPSHSLVAPKNRQLLMTFINYFTCISDCATCDETFLDKKVTYELALIKETTEWSEDNSNFRELNFCEEKRGVEAFYDATKVNFADSNPGGTILESGIQWLREEILHCIFPELLLTTLIVSRIHDDEAIIVNGLTRVSDYTGFNKTFNVGRVYSDSQHSSESVLYIDAIIGGVRNVTDLDRELNKAFIGFSKCKTESIATGNWGCGAYSGNRNLKAIIQLMAAAKAGKNLEYASFGDEKLEIKQLNDLHQLLLSRDIKTSQVYDALKSIADKGDITTEKRTVFSVVEYLMNQQSQKK